MKKNRFIPLLVSCIVIMNLLIPANAFAKDQIQIAATNEFSNEKTCSQIGMIANDRSKGKSNYTLLCNELNAGTKVLVDDKYYITGLTKGTPITKDINIVGVNDHAELSFTNNSGTLHWFNVQSNEIIMQKIRVTQLFNGFGCVFYMYNGHKIDSMRIENCYFEGNIRLITWNFKVDSTTQYLDPTTKEYGINNLIFNNNICKNLKQEYIGFICLDDVPITHVEIIGNTITNFVYTFYNQAITDDNPYANKVAERMSYLKVSDNKVKEENSWDAAPGHCSYHCFVLFEGNKCDYNNNYVEGLHVIDKVTVVYDAYLSCWNLDYEGNYWKNNICFSPTKEYADLMKSKLANKADYHGINRIYKNNTFIVEKSYADIFGRPYDELWVSLSRNQREMDTIIVENNNFDVYKLGMNYKQFAHNYTFSNNNIHAYTSQDTIESYLLPATRLVNPTLADTYIARNNEISIDEKNSSIKENFSIATIKQQTKINIVYKNNTID